VGSFLPHPDIADLKSKIESLRQRQKNAAVRSASDANAATTRPRAQEKKNKKR